MSYNELKNNDEKYVVGNYARFDLCIDRGKKSTCYDLEGNEYIDFTTGIGVNSLGFCDDGWVMAVTRQAAALNHVSNLYYTSPSTDLAKLLCTRTGCDKVFFANSGAEANEGAIKAARKYSFDKYGKERSVIVTLNGSFHGRTVTTLAATGQDAYHNYFFPFTEGFVHVEPNDIKALNAALGKDVCAVMLEFVQGEGGVRKLNDDYVKEVAKLCAERDILLIADEVQTGVGRTGTFLAAEQFKVTADITTLAKGLGGGLPIGAILFNEKTGGVLTPGTHGTTYGANPIACAAAYYTVNSIDTSLMNEVKVKSGYIRARLEKMKNVTVVDGLGMMIGFEVSEEFKPAELVKAAMDKGLLLLTAKDRVRLLPALNIPKASLERGMDIIAELLKGAEKEEEALEKAPPAKKEKKEQKK